MIVNHLNTYPSGGAAVAALRLHRALCAEGVESQFWYSRGDAKAGEAAVERLKWRDDRSGYRSRWAAKIKKYALKAELSWSLLGRPGGLDVFTVPRVAENTPINMSLATSSILQLHWVDKMIDYPSFFQSLPGGMPIVWTLHDMNPFTGGCHYANGCRKFESECGSCFQLGRSGPHDLANRSFQVKRRALEGKNLHVVADSHWLESEARQSTLLAEARSIQTIHYGLDTKVFAPRDKAAARQELELPSNRVVIGFGAESLANQRKGFEFLLDALRRLPDPSRVLALVFGTGRMPRPADNLPEFRCVGYVNDEQRLAKIYSALDFFILPSLEEAFGLTGIEAMACGTPVVAFAAGGIVDFVKHMETGLLAKVGDAADLARQIDWLAKRPADRQKMAAAARDLVVSDFDHRHQAQKYIHLYRALLADDARSADMVAA